MGLMDGLRRGLSAAGYAGADMYAKGALEDQRALIQAERDARLAEISERATIGAEQRGLANRATERGAKFQEDVDNAPVLREIKTADTIAAEKAKLDPEILALQNKAKAEALTQDEQAKLDFYAKNRSGLMGRERDMARARHIDDGAGLRAVQIEAANLSLNEKKEVNAMIKEFGETTDPARQAQIKQALTVRGIIKPGEYDTEKVTTEKMGDDGTTTKTERTQRRGAGDAATATTQAPTATGPWNKFGKGDVQPAAAVERKAAVPAAKRFNEAGYTDVQSTIDGARRGDGKALDLLQSLIRQGATTPAQRQQISEITKAK